MRKALLIVLASTILPTFSLGQDDPKLVQRIGYKAGEVLIKFRSDVKLTEDGSHAAAATDGISALAGAQAEFLGIIPERNVAHFRILSAVASEAPGDSNEKRSVMSLMQGLARANPQIEYVQRNYVYYASETPDDPLLSELRFVERIGLDKAWDVRHDAPDVIVAVIDTGVMTKHPDLEHNIWVNVNEIPNNGIDDDGNGFADDLNGWNFFNPVGGDPTADLVDQGFPFFGFCLSLGGKQFEAHGSHVAGTIGGRGNNGKGICGVAWNIKIMPVKFLGGPCGNGETANAIRAIDYAVKNGAKVINCSWGGKTENGDEGDLLLKEAIEAAGAKDVLVVCAAGNEANDNDNNPHYPSNFELTNVIAVGATDDLDKSADFSNFGKQSVDLFAPGVNIRSTVPKGSELPASEDYGDLSGTSMATPIVSGVAALVRAQYPGLSASEVRQWLMKTSDKIADLDNLCATSGRINALTALTTPSLPETLPQPLQLTATQRNAINMQLTDNDRVRMVLFGGMPLKTPEKVNTVSTTFPVEFLVKFNVPMTNDKVRKTCIGSLSEITDVETINADRNVFKVLGIGTVPPDQLGELIKENVANVVLVQPNYKYVKEKKE